MKSDFEIIFVKQPVELYNITILFFCEWTRVLLEPTGKDIPAREKKGGNKEQQHL